MATTTTPKVYEAISAVTAALSIEGIGKDRKNTQQGYSFRGIDDVYNELSPILAKNKLCILPRILTRSLIERTTQKGGVLFYVTVEAEFDLISAEDGSKHTIRTFGEAMDSADKATNKAMSAAYKYAAMQAFCIPTEGDNDADAQSHDVAPQQKVAPKTKADSRETFDRLSKANRALPTVDAFNVFWAKESVKAAANSLPIDWKKTLIDEKSDKAAELAERASMQEADPFTDPVDPTEQFDRMEAAE